MRGFCLPGTARSLELKTPEGVSGSRLSRLGEGLARTLRAAAGREGGALAVLSILVFVHAFEASVCCSLRFVARPFGNAQNCIFEGRGLLGLLFSGPSNSSTLRATLFEKHYFQEASLFYSNVRAAVARRH